MKIEELVVLSVDENGNTQVEGFPVSYSSLKVDLSHETWGYENWGNISIGKSRPEYDGFRENNGRVLGVYNRNSMRDLNNMLKDSESFLEKGKCRIF